jgi:hypothetical protein
LSLSYILISMSLTLTRSALGDRGEPRGLLLLLNQLLRLIILEPHCRLLATLIILSLV